MLTSLHNYAFQKISRDESLHSLSGIPCVVMFRNCGALYRVTINSWRIDKTPPADSGKIRG